MCTSATTAALRMMRVEKRRFTRMVYATGILYLIENSDTAIMSIHTATTMIAAMCDVKAKSRAEATESMFMCECHSPVERNQRL